MRHGDAFLAQVSVRKGDVARKTEQVTGVGGGHVVAVALGRVAGLDPRFVAKTFARDQLYQQVNLPDAVFIRQAVFPFQYLDIGALPNAGAGKTVEGFVIIFLAVEVALTHVKVPAQKTGTE